MHELLEEPKPTIPRRTREGLLKTLGVFCGDVSCSNLHAAKRIGVELPAADRIATAPNARRQNAITLRDGEGRAAPTPCWAACTWKRSKALLPGLPGFGGLPTMLCPEPASTLVVVVEEYVAPGNASLSKSAQTVLNKIATNSVAPEGWRDRKVMNCAASPVVTTQNRTNESRWRNGNGTHAWVAGQEEKQCFSSVGLVQPDSIASRPEFESIVEIGRTELTN